MDAGDAVRIRLSKRKIYVGLRFTRPLSLLGRLPWSTHVDSIDLPKVSANICQATPTWQNGRFTPPPMKSSHLQSGLQICKMPLYPLPRGDLKVYHLLSYDWRNFTSQWCLVVHQQNYKVLNHLLRYSNSLEYCKMNNN